MTYAVLKRRLDDGDIIILDGATGTELQRRGVPMDPSAWCGPATLGNDALLTQIHLDYIHAGADVITTNTFAASRLMLTPAGYGDRVAEIGRRAVEAALEARARAPAGRAIAVGGSLSHMVPVAEGTDKVDPRLTPSDAEVADALHELAALLKASGVDHIMLEMMYHPGRTRLAVAAALATSLPVWFGLSARRGKDGRVLSFHKLEDVPLGSITDLVPRAGIDAAGCMHTRVDIVGDALAELRTVFTGPLMAYPDSGYFEMPDWQFAEIIEPERLIGYFRGWLDRGVQIIGGCCGLTVPHIEAAVRAREDYLAR